ncbi:MAG: hypothetical protein OEZ43_05975 [Gammaproteobacteria bacterium]|nr:hypothetical protein [Gammaproteobacteria bacterium]
MTMNNWLVDADNLNLSTLNKEKYLFKNSTVESFISGGRNIVCAPKGFGKTLLLKYISNRYTEASMGGQDAIRIPYNREIDYFQQVIDAHSAITSRTNSDTWKDFWIICICLSVITNYAIRTKDKVYLADFVSQINKEIGQLHLSLSIIKQISHKLNQGDEISRFDMVRLNPTEILSLLLQESPEELFQSRSRLLVAVRQACSIIERPIVIFIDKVDQGVDNLPFQAWADAQNGLAQAVYHIKSMNSQIKIFASIRMEAWAVFKHQLRLQYSDNIAEIRYSHSDLEHIFENAITTFEDKDSLRQPNELETNPVKAFSGIDTINNEWAGEDETAIDYLIRYSLGRPRDLMMLGKVIHEHARDLDESQFRDIVGEKTSREIENSYLCEVEKFTATDLASDLPKALKHVDSNIITKTQLYDACYKYNRQIVEGCVAKKGASCSDCKDAKKIFQDMYAVGLLGTVSHDEDGSNNLYRQHFCRIGDYSGNELPISDWYILHPAAKWCARNANANYKGMRGILTGNGKEWKSEYADKINMNWLVHEARKIGLFDENFSERILNHLRKMDDHSMEVKKDFEKAKKKISLNDAKTVGGILVDATKIIDAFYKWVV